jgi:hypothetical protein
VFDLDGTLTDNMECHAEAFALFLRRHGLPGMTMAMRQRLDGKRNSEIFPILFCDLTLRSFVRSRKRKERVSRAVTRAAQPLAGRSHCSSGPRAARRGSRRQLQSRTWFIRFRPSVWRSHQRHHA